MKGRRRPPRDPRDDEVVSRVEFSMADVYAGHSPRVASLLGLEVAAPAASGGKAAAGDAAERGAGVRAPGSGRRMRDLVRVDAGNWTCTLGGVPWALRSSDGRWVAEGGGESREAGSFKEIVGALRKM